MTYTLHEAAILIAMVNARFDEDVKIADYANFKHRKV